MLNRSHTLFSISFFALLFIAMTFVSCNEGKKNKDARTDTSYSGKCTIMCDESFSPIINEEVVVFEAQHPDAKVKVDYTNEIDAMNALMQQKVHLIITSRNFSAKEKNFFVTNKLNPIAFPIGYDGLAFIINKANVDSCIHVEDIKRILSGKFTKWKQVNPMSKIGSMSIDVVFDNKQSAAVHWAVDSILGGKPINSPNITAVQTSEEVINYVEKTKNAIGIIGSNWLNDKRDTTNVTFKKNIQVMNVCSVKGKKAGEMNSWKPYQLYLLDGRYPFARTLYALYVDPYDGLPRGFANFLQLPIGQRIILKSALLPYRGDLQWRRVDVHNE